MADKDFKAAPSKDAVPGSTLSSYFSQSSAESKEMPLSFNKACKKVFLKAKKRPPAGRG